jgi:hypothetical protein
VCPTCPSKKFFSQGAEIANLAPYISKPLTKAYQINLKTWPPKETLPIEQQDNSFVEKISETHLKPYGP